MKILKSWLKDFVKIDKLSDVKIDDMLTFSGIEVEGAEKAIPDSVIVAEILEIKPHPNADRLQISTVNTGAGTLEIVCGAPNIKVGQKVPLAQIGSILPGNFEIKEAIIRGVNSHGMLCAADELGLGSDHSGIITLPDDAVIGDLASSFFDGDVVFDLKPTPNRGDCFSHLGIAREIAALTDQVTDSPALFTPPSVQAGQATSVRMTSERGSDLKIEIKDKDGCPAYYGAYITGVKIETSPEWLQKRLVAVGAKPINNIVDITNYCMLDLGQPMHAFDAAKVSDKHIIIRSANSDERIITLDGAEHKLTPDNLLITDREKPIAIAGVMGAQNSEISSTTTDIILESAEFAPTVIRKSAKMLNLSTEASYRFERGVDSKGVEIALHKAASMIVEIAGGKLIDLKSEIAKEHAEKSVKIPADRINALLGLDLKRSEIDDILSRLGFKIEGELAKAPSWRRDVSIWQDLAEEVGRVYGLNNIGTQNLPKLDLTSISDYHKKEYIKDLLVEDGFNEVATYSIISEDDAKLAQLDTSDLLEIANPVQPENKYMRNSLIPGLLKTIAKNPTFDPVLIFEFGNVFSKNSELTNIAIAASGKGAKEIIIKAVNCIKSDLYIKRDIKVKELSSEDVARYKIRKPITYFVELNALDLILESNFGDKDLTLKLTDKEIYYRPISKFPSVTRDLAFIVDAEVDPSKVIHTIYDQSKIINRVELFDEFTSDKFGINKKNVAFHLYLQEPDRTLTDSEADQIINSAIHTIEKQFNAKIRE